MYVISFWRKNRLATRQVRRKRAREKIEKMMREKETMSGIRKMKMPGMRKMKMPRGSSKDRADIIRLANSQTKKSSRHVEQDYRRARSRRWSKIPFRSLRVRSEKARSSRVRSEKVVLDTNVILDSLNENFVKEMQQLLKKSGIRIILSEIVLGEVTGSDRGELGSYKKNDVLDHLKNRFGERLEIVKTTPEMKEDARKMEEKYDVLHSPDSIILAVCKKVDAVLITNDFDLTDCAKQEEVDSYDHRYVEIEPTRYELLQEQREEEERRKSG